MNFIERFAHLANLQATVREIDPNTFVSLPEDTISWAVLPDHVVVWFRFSDETYGLSKIGQDAYLTYHQAFAALVPIDIPAGDIVSPDLVAVLESAPEEVLTQFAEWARDYNPERYPSVQEVWEWLNSQFGVSYVRS